MGTTRITDLKNDLSRARHEALVFGWAALALTSGDAEEKTIRTRSVDGEAWKVRLVQWKTPAGNPESVVFRSLGADRMCAEMTDDFLRLCDAEVNRLGREYAAFGVLSGEIRAALREAGALAAV